VQHVQVGLGRSHHERDRASRQVARRRRHSDRLRGYRDWRLAVDVTKYRHAFDAVRKPDARMRANVFKSDVQRFGNRGGSGNRPFPLVLKHERKRTWVHADPLGELARRGAIARQQCGKRVRFSAAEAAA
jgi:hypothetical protein